MIEGGSLVHANCKLVVFTTRIEVEPFARSASIPLVLFVARPREVGDVLQNTVGTYTLSQNHQEQV